jgi:hypothetical protein
MSTNNSTLHASADRPTPHHPLITIIPAQAGWATVEAFFDDDGRVDELYLQPILAWRVETHVTNKNGAELFESTTPICVEILSRAALGCIKTPAGHFIFVEDCSFPTEQQAIDYFQTKRARALRTAAKDAARSIDESTQP